MAPCGEVSLAQVVSHQSSMSVPANTTTLPMPALWLAETTALISEAQPWPPAYPPLAWLVVTATRNRFLPGNAACQSAEIVCSTPAPQDCDAQAPLPRLR